MAEFPSLPLFTDAMIADTHHLSDEEFGLYVRMLMYAWRDKDCSLPTDRKKLGRMVKISHTAKKKFEVVEYLLESFFYEKNDKFFQKRLLKERKYLSDQSETNSLAGKISSITKRLNSLGIKLTNVDEALKRGSNDDKTAFVTKWERKLNEKATPTPTPHLKEDIGIVSTTETLPEKERTTSLLSLCPESDRDENGYPPEFETFWKTYNRKNDKKASAFKSWQKAIKTSHPDKILHAARAYLASLEPEKRHGEFQAMAATWLNQQRYEDDYQPYGQGSLQDGPQYATGYQG